MESEFVVSAAAPEQFPAEDLPEIAFLGRSNVGKSSLLNCLVGKPALAITSARPGIPMAAALASARAVLGRAGWNGRLGHLRLGGLTIAIGL